MSDLRYGIFPPRYAGNSVYYKDLVVLEMINTEINRLFVYDLNGEYTIIPPVGYKDIGTKLITDYDTIQDPSNNIINSTYRTIWSFRTKEEAFLQKLILLNHIRKYFNRKEQEQRAYFDSKIPEEIEQVLQKQKEKYPELIL